jgi:hypothetical protein
MNIPNGLLCGFGVELSDWNFVWIDWSIWPPLPLDLLSHGPWLVHAIC